MDTIWREREHPRTDFGTFTDKTASAPEGQLPRRRPSTDINEIMARRAEIQSRAAERTAVADILAIQQRNARVLARRYQLNEADLLNIVQDTSLHLLNRQVNGTLGSLVGNEALVTVTTQAIASTYLYRNVRHEEMTARAILQEAVDTERQVLGREPSDDEIADIAADVLTLWSGKSAKNRPHPDFYKVTRITSLDAPVFGDGTGSLADTLADTRLEHPMAEDTSKLGDLFDGLGVVATSDITDVNDVVITKRGAYVPELSTADGELITRTTEGKLRRDIWNHLAEAQGTVPATARSLRRTEISAVNAKVAAYPGGVVGLCQDWSKQMSPADMDAVLFAPFGTLTYAQQEQVVDMLASRPIYAERLFASAMKIAEVR